MPKIRRKDRTEKKVMSDEEECSEDGVSVCSITSIQSEAPTEGALTDEGDLSSAEIYEEKICSVLEAITEKNVKTRVEGLKSLRSGLSKKFAFEFLSQRSMTLVDSVDKCVRKGRGEEQVLAAPCHALTLLQLAPDPSLALDLFNKVVLPTFKVVISDESVPLEARCACLESLGLCIYFSVSDQLELRSLAQLIKDLSSSSHLQAIGVQISALRMWSLIFTLLTPDYVIAVAQDHLRSLSSRLESSSVEMRVAAGEAIAVVMEAAFEADEDFEYNKIDELCESLLLLTKESNKFRAKKDRKVQKASFREILKFVEDGDFKEMQVSISKQEQLSILSWAHYSLYHSLTTLLTSGMNTHLKENPAVREMFGLGDVLAEEGVVKSRGSKYDKLLHKNAFKELTKHRQKQRSKKNDKATYMDE